MTFVCVPIMVRALPTALAQAESAKERGADLVEFRLDECFSGSDDPDETQLALDLCAKTPLPCIITCRPSWEGGMYDGDDMARVALFERLGTCEHPPRYIDVELAAYTRSANLRQKVNLAVEHPKQVRDLSTSLILSIHDFDGRPADLSRRLAAAYAEDAASIVKVAYHARSLRDNLELFEILRDAPKPTIALGMGEFGLMSRVLAPKFGGFLTFASLHKTEVTAPGQPTLEELFDLYRFRSIGKQTRVYGVIGWPVGHSMSPLVHNAGFETIGWDGVYLPLPVAAGDDEEASYTSFKATVGALIDSPTLGFTGASVTLPHKQNLKRMGLDESWLVDVGPNRSANTLARLGDRDYVTDTDSKAAQQLLEDRLGDLQGKRVCLVGTGGVARSIADELLASGADVVLVSREMAKSEKLTAELNEMTRSSSHVTHGSDETRSISGGTAHAADDVRSVQADAYTNCTPVGMTGGPDPDGLSIPLDEIESIAPETVIFDTVYNPIETPLIRAARAQACTVIDGAAMFVAQASEQFRIWTDHEAPVGLFDRLVRERLGQ